MRGREGGKEFFSFYFPACLRNVFGEASIFLKHFIPLEVKDLCIYLSPQWTETTHILVFKVFLESAQLAGSQKGKYDRRMSMNKRNVSCKLNKKIKDDHSSFMYGSFIIYGGSVSCQDLCCCSGWKAVLVALEDTVRGRHRVGRGRVTEWGCPTLLIQSSVCHMMVMSRNRVAQ